MQPQPKHLSPWIAWSLLVLVIGIAAFFVWNYYSDATAAWDNSVFSSLPTKHKTTTTTTPATSTTTTTTTATKTYTNSKFGFSFTYPSTTTVTELTTSLSANSAGSKVIQIVASDFKADIYVANSIATGSNSGSNVIALYKNNQLSNATQISKTTSLAAANFSFSLLDVNADPNYVSAFAALTNTLVDVSFSSINGSSTMTSHTQTDLPQSAKNLLVSFTKL